MAVAVRAAERAISDVAGDDASLIARVSKGDRAALGVLYDRYASVLVAAGVRMLGTHREAQDLLHDVFLEAWQHAHAYDAARGSVRTWLLVRLRSRALDRMGRAEALRTQSLDLAPSEFAADVSRRRADAVDCLAVRQALERVPEDVRDVLDLTYFRGLSAREIAAEIGVPVGTVKSRLARGRDALASLLRDHERGGADA